MKIGIDFGTSYSAAAFASDGRVRKIKFGSDTQFRTAVYFPEAIPTLEDFEMSPQIQKMADDLFRRAKSDQSRSILEAQSRIADAMKEKDSLKRASRLELIAVPRERSDDELRKDIVRTVRQQWLEDETRRARTSVAQSANAVFGDEAIEAFLAEGTGHLIQSPKSMFGFDFNARARSTVVDITANILEHIRSMATRQLKRPVRQAVVGRPVQFRSSLGDKGNEQAVALLQEAAIAAGFDAIQFMEEPIAAAMNFHRKSPDRLRALILDVGGGTTDVAYAELGGSRRPKLLSSWGLPKGGSDVDVALSLESFMPHFGSTASAVPAHHYYEAAIVQDLDRQRKFLEHSYVNVPRPFGPRLRRLQVTGMTTRLNRAVERSKIHLSDHENCSIRIGYIEKNLAVRTNRVALNEATSRFRSDMMKLLADVSQSLDRAPDRLFLTGGMSRSPFVIELAQACFPSSRIVRGDAAYGVVSGLALAAST